MATIKSYTDLEQSKKLAEILPLESADMKWFFWKEEIDAPKTPTFVYSKTAAESYKDTEAVYLACWSLAALLGVIKKYGLIDLRFLSSTFDGRGEHLTNVWCCTFDDIGGISLDMYADNPVDACVAMIEKLNELKML